MAAGQNVNHPRILEGIFLNEYLYFYFCEGLKRGLSDACAASAHPYLPTAEKWSSRKLRPPDMQRAA